MNLKGIVILLAIGLAFGLATGVSVANAGRVQHGDVDCSGRVDSIDAAVVLQYVAGFIENLPCPGNAELNGDGMTTALEAALILQFGAGLIDELGPPVAGPSPRRPAASTHARSPSRAGSSAGAATGSARWVTGQPSTG